MRIAMFVTDFPALSTTFILNQMVGVLAAGHHLEVFALRRRDEAGKVHALVQHWGLRERTTYLPARPRGKGRRLWHGARLAFRYAAWRRPRALARTLDVGRFERSARSLELFYAALPLLGRRYDVLHCQFGTLGRLVGDLREAGVLHGRLVVSFRGYDATEYVRREADAYRRLFRQGDLFLPVSESLRRTILHLGAPPACTEVLHSGIDVDRFTLRPRRAPATGPVELVSVARLVEKKGLEYAIRAVAELSRRGHRIRYTILGDGPLHDSLQQLARDCGLERVVHLAGWCDQEEVIGALERAHVFVLPSVTAANGDQEGIPNALKEAMAMGMPVVATCHAGIPELVEEGVSGFLAAERDAHSLADCLERLLRAPDRWPAMGRAGRARVAADFDNRRLNQTLLRLYAEQTALVPGGAPHEVTAVGESGSYSLGGGEYPSGRGPSRA